MDQDTSMKKHKNSAEAKRYVKISNLESAEKFNPAMAIPDRPRHNIREVLTTTSDDGRYCLIIAEVGDPEFPFGPTTCRFTLKKGSHTIIQKPFTVLNDGAHVDNSNFSVTWGKKDVSITVTGDEQSPVIYKIAYDGSYP